MVGFFMHVSLLMLLQTYITDLNEGKIKNELGIVRESK
ncbi:hypothetical protein ABFX02_14G120200 [Erythranthe guttata]